MCLVFQTFVRNSQVVAQQGTWDYNKNIEKLKKVNTFLQHKFTPLLQE